MSESEHTVMNEMVDGNSTDWSAYHPDCQNISLLLSCPPMFVEKYGYDTFYLCFQLLQDYMSYDELKKQTLARVVIYGCLLSIVCIAGIIGNILSYIIMRSREYRGSTTAIYLQVLMIMDSLYLMGNFMYYGIILGCGVGKWMVSAFPGYTKIYLSYTLIDIFRNCSVLLTLVVTAERYICVCHGLHAGKVCTPKLSRIVSGITVAVTFLYEIPRFFILEVNTKKFEDCEGQLYFVEPTGPVPVIAEDIQGYLGFVLFLVLPLITTTILTVLLLNTIKKSTVFRKSMRSTIKSNVSDKDGNTAKAKSNETNTTIILLSVVITSIICSLPNTLLILSRFTTWGDEVLMGLPGSICYYIGILLLNINSAANVLLFCFFGKRFRRVFRRVFIRCYWGERRKGEAYRIVSSQHTVQSHVEHSVKENGSHENMEMKR